MIRYFLLLFLLTFHEVNSTFPTGIARSSTLVRNVATGTQTTGVTRYALNTQIHSRPVIGQFKIAAGQAGMAYCSALPDFEPGRCGAKLTYSRILNTATDVIAHHRGAPGQGFWEAGNPMGFTATTTLRLGGATTTVAIGNGGNAGQYCSSGSQGSGVFLHNGVDGWYLIAATGGSKGGCCDSGTGNTKYGGDESETWAIRNNLIDCAFVATASNTIQPTRATIGSQVSNAAGAASYASKIPGGGGSATTFTPTSLQTGEGMYLDDTLGQMESTVYSTNPNTCSSSTSTSTVAHGNIALDLYEIDCTVTCGDGAYCAYDKTTFETKCITCPEGTFVDGGESWLHTCSCPAGGFVWNEDTEVCECPTGSIDVGGTCEYYSSSSGTSSEISSSAEVFSSSAVEEFSSSAEEFSSSTGLEFSSSTESISSTTENHISSSAEEFSSSTFSSSTGEEFSSSAVVYSSSTGTEYSSSTIDPISSSVESYSSSEFTPSSTANIEFSSSIIPQSFCDLNPCQNGATCIDGIASYSCVCAAGYSGINCSVNMDDCSNNPCKNDAICTDGIASYSCVCAAGYTGTNCTINIDECSTSPCLHGSTCNDGINSYTCTCTTGYTGNNCSIDIDDCSTSPCKNSGSCTDGVSSFLCQCTAGFTGVNCTINMDECAVSPCQNGALCYDGTNSYVCECPQGYTDANCSTNINDCNSSPCQNGGTCIDGTNSFSCVCLSLYTGVNCTLSNLSSSSSTGASSSSTSSISSSANDGSSGLILSSSSSSSTGESSSSSSTAGAGPVCLPGSYRYGPSCALCNCLGNAQCYDGNANNGTCYCIAPGSFYSISYGGCDCIGNYAGEGCEIPCTGCTPGAVCDKGTSGDGSCTCLYPTRMSPLNVTSCDCNDGLYGEMCLNVCDEAECDDGEECITGLYGGCVATPTVLFSSSASAYSSSSGIHISSSSSSTAVASSATVQIDNSTSSSSSSTGSVNITIIAIPAPIASISKFAKVAMITFIVAAGVLLLVAIIGFLKTSSFSLFSSRSALYSNQLQENTSQNAKQSKRLLVDRQTIQVDIE